MDNVYADWYAECEPLTPDEAKLLFPKIALVQGSEQGSQHWWRDGHYGFRGYAVGPDQRLYMFDKYCGNIECVYVHAGAFCGLGIQDVEKLVKKWR